MGTMVKVAVLTVAAVAVADYITGTDFFTNAKSDTEKMVYRYGTAAAAVYVVDKFLV